MTFRRYTHVEKIDHPEVMGLETGTVHVFPKLDGTNACVWWDNGIQVGNRKRQLAADRDNRGFFKWAHSAAAEARAVSEYCHRYRHRVVYGEWLVPHSFKGYREGAWRRLWIFDVYDRELSRYLSVEEYSAELEDLGADVIPPLAVLDNPVAAQLQDLSNRNHYLIPHLQGPGEGLVLKNYGWRNQFGRQAFAKMVRSEFKELHSKGPRGERDIAAEIVDLATEAFIHKEFMRVVDTMAEEKGVALYDTLCEPAHLGPTFVHVTAFIRAYRAKLLPRTLGTLFFVFMQEEIRTIMKKWKNPVIDLPRVQELFIERTKQVLAEVL